MSGYPFRNKVKKGSLKGKKYPVINDFYKQLKAFPKGVTYICLQEQTELKRLGLPQYYSKKTSKKARKITKVNFKFENDLEIRDVSVSQDSQVFDYVYDLYDRYQKGENFVIHCLGGHGRTGTVCGILLGMILAGNGIVLNTVELLDALQECHSQRKERNGWLYCPQTSSQELQVKKLYKRFLYFNDIEVPLEPVVQVPQVPQVQITSSGIWDFSVLDSGSESDSTEQPPGLFDWWGEDDEKGDESTDRDDTVGSLWDYDPESKVTLGDWWDLVDVEETPIVTSSEVPEVSIGKKKKRRGKKKKKFCGSHTEYVRETYGKGANTIQFTMDDLID